MAYLCADKSGEYIADNRPLRDFYYEWNGYDVDTDGVSCTLISLPKGTIKKLIGRDLTWEDEPVEI